MTIASNNCTRSAKKKFMTSTMQTIKWLMVNHPDDIPFTEWVEKTSSTVSTSAASLQPNKSTRSNEVTVNYKSVYEALDRPRKCR